MADRRAVRSTSRRKTPTPQPPSRGTTPTAARSSTRTVTRGTRSQSREVETAVGAAPTTKTTRRGGRQTSTESVESTANRASRSTRGQKGKNTRAAPVGDLTTVEEDEDAENAEQVEDPLPEQERPGTPPPHQVNQPLPHRSPGGLSNISGTTAYSSASMAEAQDLEAGLMLEDLEDLYTTTESFLKVMAPEDARSRDFERIIKDLRIPGSSTSKRFLKRSKAFDEYAEAYHSNGEYILPRAVAQTLFGSQQDLESITGRPDAVLYKANLAVLAKRILTDRGSGTIWKDVQQLDLSFPERFLSRFSDELNEKGDTSALLDETFKLALEIRTRVAILELTQERDDDENFDPDGVLASVFCHPLQDPDDDDAVPLVRGWNTHALGGSQAELPHPFKVAVVRRMNDIRTFVDQETSTIDIDALHAKYSWDAFSLRVLRWVRDRSQEIEASISELGIKALKDRVERSVRLLNPRAAPEEGSTRGPRISNVSNLYRKSRRSLKDPEKAVHFAAYQFLGAPGSTAVEKIPEKSKAAAPAEVNQDTDANDWQAAPVGDDEELEDPHEESSTSQQFPPSTNDRVARLAQEERTQKENQKQRFIDPQANRERVEWSEDIDDTPRRSSKKGKGKGPVRQASTASPAQQRPSTTAPTRPQKRTRAAIEEESTDDEDFQQDNRRISPSKRRNTGPTASHARFETPIEVPPSHQQQPPSARRFPENRARVRLAAPVSEDEDFENDNHDEDAAPPSSGYTAVRQQAKRMVPTFQARQQQRKSRNYWNAAAEEQLVQYIEEYGCRWKYIQRLDEGSTRMFLGRSDVDLKDKARNMKVNYLRSGTGLPENFDYITLNKSLLARYGLDQ